VFRIARTLSFLHKMIFDFLNLFVLLSLLCLVLLEFTFKFLIVDSFNNLKILAEEILPIFLAGVAHGDGKVNQLLAH
jgi:uncharacterized membrane protein YbhN (UPF0104 family)